jgi:superfamily II DNA or RNA helicase
MAIPIGLIDVREQRKALTITYQPMGADEPSVLECFRLTKTHLHVPRQYGLDLCARLEIDFKDETSPGAPVEWARVPRPRLYQIKALDQLQECLDDYYDFIFRARTGWGKTVGALITAARREVSAIIIVDQENLKDQWIATLTDPNLFGLSVDDIGIIQGKRCDYEGKAVTIAMVQTLSQKTFPKKVYDYFGMLIVDEVHIIGAPTFSVVLMQFSAMYRFGVSATPKRRDGLQKVLDWNLGRPRLWIEDEHDESAVYVAEHFSVYSAYANQAPKIGRFITEIADDGSRNLLVAEAAAYLYDTGRDILVLSDRIEQLRDIQSLLYYLGIPEEETGLYAGYCPSYGYEKDPKPLKRPEDWQRGTDYTPVHLTLISKRRKKQILTSIKENARIILATYGMFAKGVDVPRLSGGVDASPRSTSEQMQGRILRKLDGKKKPIWITVTDPNSYRSMFSLAQRIGDYIKNNSVVSKWSLEKGKEPCNAKSLRSDLYAQVERLKKFMRIETNSVGLNTILTRQQQMNFGDSSERSTSPRPSRPVVRRALRTVSSRVEKSAR